MITVNYPEKPINMKNLHLVFFNKEYVEQIARLMVADHLECFLDMAQDMDKRPQSFAETETYLDGVKCSLSEGYLPELLSDFREALYEAVEKVQFELKNVKITKEGLDDVEIEVS